MDSPVPFCFLCFCCLFFSSALVNPPLSPSHSDRQWEDPTCVSCFQSRRESCLVTAATLAFAKCLRGQMGDRRQREGSSGRITAPHYRSPNTEPKLFMAGMSHTHQLSRSSGPTVIKQPRRSPATGQEWPHDISAVRNLNPRLFLLLQNTNANVLTSELLAGMGFQFAKVYCQAKPLTPIRVIFIHAGY